MPRYKTLRLREEDYEKLKEVQQFLLRKGTDSIDWDTLREQHVVDLPDLDEENTADGLTAGAVIGLGAAALAQMVLKSVQKELEATLGAPPKKR